MDDSKDKKDQKSDPTKDPEFKKVVKHFLNTPPKPHSKKKPPTSEGGKNKDSDK